MLNLVKYEWKAKGKKGLLLGMVFLVLAIMALVLRQKYISYAYDTVTDIESIRCFINTPGGLIFSLSMLLAQFVYMVLLGITVWSIIWDEQKMKGGYLLLTTPEPVAKILAAKLLAIFPLLLIMAVINPTQVLGAFGWWGQVLIFYVGIMLGIFISVLGKTMLVGSWYKERLSVIGFSASVVMGFAVFASFEGFDIETLGVPHFLIFLLIGTSIALFVTSAYLLENKVDI